MGVDFAPFAFRFFKIQGFFFVFVVVIVIIDDVSCVCCFFRIFFVHCVFVWCFWCALFDSLLLHKWILTYSCIFYLIMTNRISVV